MNRFAHRMSMQNEHIAQTIGGTAGLSVTETARARTLLTARATLRGKPKRKFKVHARTASKPISHPGGCAAPGEHCRHALQGSTDMPCINHAMTACNPVAPGAYTCKRRQAILYIATAGRRLFGSFTAIPKWRFDRSLRHVIVATDHLDVRATP